MPTPVFLLEDLDDCARRKYIIADDGHNFYEITFPSGSEVIYLIDEDEIEYTLQRLKK